MLYHTTGRLLLVVLFVTNLALTLLPSVQSKQQEQHQQQRMLVEEEENYPGHPFEQHRRMMVGGYSEIPDPSENPRLPEITAFVLHEIVVGNSPYFFANQVGSNKNDVTVIVCKAFQQVVAGMNYRLVLLLERNSESIAAFKVTVYDRFGNLSVTTWGEDVPVDHAKAILNKEQDVDQSDFYR